MVAQFGEILLSKCSQFRDEHTFIDVRLKVGEDIFPAHRIVLAANSKYFYAMFTDGMIESNQEVIELKDESITPDALQIIMNSIYTGDLHVTEENVSEVLAAADHLQVASVVHMCCNFLLTEFVKLRFDFETYCRIWEIAFSYGLKDLQDAAECNVAKMYKDVCESKEFLTHIGGHQLFSLLSRDDLSAPSETFVFKSVMQWIKHKKERMTVAGKVIGAVRLGLVDIRVVIADLNTEEMQRIPEIHTQVYEAAVYKHMPSQKPKFSVEQTKPRSKSPVLVAVLPQAGIQYFDVEAKAWKSTRTPRIEATHCYCAESVGSKLIVAANDAIGCCIYRYDTEANVWERHPHSCAVISKLCVLEDYMYAFRADCIQSPQRYNLAKRQWQIFANVGITSNNSNSYISCGAAVLHSEVFVLYGNYQCLPRNPYDLSMKPAVLHCFDPQKNKWEVKATTRHCHFGSSLFAVNSKLYVAGGNVKIDYNNCPRGNPAPVEVYNEENNTWSVVVQNHIPYNARQQSRCRGNRREGVFYHQQISN